MRQEAKLDIHNYNKILKSQLSNLKGLKHNNNKLILDFYNKYCIKKGLSIPRQAKLLANLKTVAVKLNKPLNKINAKGVEKLIINLNKEEYAATSIKDYKVVLKLFLKTYNKKKFAELIASDDLKATIPKSQEKKIMPEDLLTKEEKIKLLNACMNPCHLALTSTLMESGARVSEVGNAKLKHLEFDEDGCILTVNGKTGPRPIRLIISRQYLWDWANKHHFYRNNLEAPLFHNVNGKQMTYASIRSMLIKLKKRAGINKKVNPHAFRHARASELLQDPRISPSVVNKYLGWELSSKMHKVYGHIGYDVVNEQINGLYGKETPKPKNNGIEMKSCLKCGKRYPPTRQYCEKCNLPLDVNEIIQKEDERNKKIDEMLKWFDAVNSDPIAREKWAELQDYLESKKSEAK